VSSAIYNIEAVAVPEVEPIAKSSNALWCFLELREVSQFVFLHTPPSHRTKAVMSAPSASTTGRTQLLPSACIPWIAPLGLRINNLPSLDPTKTACGVAIK
jgi:hypothetical protein